jgi:peptidoglycan hydrolase CwlO-like protein
VRKRVTRDEIKELAEETIKKLKAKRAEFEEEVRYLLARIDDLERKIRWLSKEFLTEGRE